MKQIKAIPKLVFDEHFKDKEFKYYNYACFISILDIDNLIFTKLDETKSFGNVISFSHKTKKSITYFSIGQNVPDDLIAADASFLIDCFMNNECSKEI